MQLAHVPLLIELFGLFQCTKNKINTQMVSRILLAMSLLFLQYAQTYSYAVVFNNVFNTSYKTIRENITLRAHLYYNVYLPLLT